MEPTLPSTTHPAGEPAPPTWTDLTKYLIGEATLEESRRVEQWAAADSEREAWTSHIRASWPVRRKNRDPERVESGLARVLERSRSVASPPKTQTVRFAGAKIPVRSPQHRTVWYAAAGFVIAAAGFFVGRQVTHARGDAHAPSVTTYTTAPGQRANITLSDGSTVSLNVASRLDVPADYAAGNRVLRLRGEAFFAVAHHDRTGFMVIAGAATTRVLGTSFVVRNYPTDTSVTVAVRDGKVMVQSSVVTAERQAEVSRTGGVRVRPADMRQFSFVTGVLDLSGKSLPEAIPLLNRWFDADVRLGDPVLAVRQFGGGVTTGSLTDLASMLELALDVRVVRDGRVLTLYSR